MALSMVVSTAVVGISAIGAGPAGATGTSVMDYETLVVAAHPTMWWRFDPTKPALAAAGGVDFAVGSGLYKIGTGAAGVPGPFSGQDALQPATAASCAASPGAPDPLLSGWPKDAGETYTIESWVQLADPSFVTTYGAYATGLTGNWVFGLSSAKWAAAPGPIAGWHHLAQVITPTSADLYLDGVSQVHNSFSSYSPPWASLSVGLNGGTCGTHGSDAIAEGAIYNYALPPKTIATHACAYFGTGSPSCNTAGPDVARQFGSGATKHGGLVGEPVNASTGNLSETDTDISSPGDVYGMDFVRSYNSEDGIDGLFGPGWTSTLDASITAYDTAGYGLRMPDGRRFSITPNGSGGWTVPGDLYATFSMLSGGTGYSLNYGSGEKWVFDPTGRLISMNNGFGQNVSIAWGSSGGFPVTVSSTNSGQAGWTYQLLGPDSSSGRPTAVVGPYVTGSSSTGAPEVDFGYQAFNGGTRLLKASRPFASGGTPAAWQTYSLDTNGFVSTITDDYGATGQPQLTKVASTFDLYGAVQTQTLLGGEQLTLNYSAPASTLVTDKDGATGPSQTLSYYHDSAGTLTQVTDPFGTSLHQALVNGKLATFNTRPTTAGSASTNLTTDSSTGAVSKVDLPNPSSGAAVSGSGGSVTSFCSGDARPTAATDQAGVSTSVSYGSTGCAAGTDLPSSVTVGGATETIAAQTISGGGASNLPATVTDADGDVTTSFWDIGKREMLSSTDNPGSGVRTTFYGYDAAGRQTVVRTPTGVETWTVYNPDGTIFSTVGPVLIPLTTRACPMSATSCTFPSSPPSGPTTSYQYYLDGSRKQMTDPGTQTTGYAMAWPGGGGSVSTVTPPAHTASDGSSVRDVTITTSDALGRVITTTEGDPSRPTEQATTTDTYEDPKNPTAGSLQRVSYETGPTGVRTYYTYDADGNVIATQVGGTPPDRTTGSSPSLGSNGCWNIPTPYGDPTHTTTTTYDLRGRTTDVCGPTGDTSPTGAVVRTHTHYDYDNDDRVIEETDGDTTGVQTRTRYSYDPTTGFLTRKIAALDDSASGITSSDQVTEYFYSKAGRLLVTFTDPVDATTFAWPTSTPLATLNTSGQPVINAQGTRSTQYVRDSAGQISQIIDPLGRSSFVSYTADGQILKKKAPGGAYHQYTYDAFGNIATDTTPSPTGTGTVVAVSRVYDARGLLATVTTPPTPGNTASSTITNQYYPDGLLSTVTNALGGTPGPTNPNTVTYTYDSRNNRTERTSLVNPDPAHPSTYSTVNQTWAYSLADRVTEASPDGTTSHTTGYIYDDNTNPNASAYPHGTTTTNQGTGRLLTTVQPSGRSTTTAYWGSGRPSETWSDQGTSEVTTQTWFDELGRRTKVHDTINGTSGEDSTYSYDALGDLTGTTEPPSPANPSATYSYTYDLNGLPQTLTYPDTSQHTFVHDKLGRLVQSNVVWPGLGQWPIVSYTYDTNGNRTKQSVDYNRGVTTWTYPANEAPQPSNYTQTINTAPTTSTNMTWGADGRLASETNGSTTLAYTYDTAGQLLTRTGGAANQSYSYDSHGDRLMSSVDGTNTTSTYNTLDQLVSAQAVTGSSTANLTYLWDADGRRTSAANSATGATTVTGYDLRGLPTSEVTTAGGSTTASTSRVYNADRQPIRYTDAGSGVSFDFVWDDSLPLPIIMDAYNGPSLWSRVNYGLDTLGYQLSTGGTPVFFAYDAHRDVINSTDNTSAPAAYNPYGPPTTSTAPQATYGYRDQLQLGDLVHLGHRDYDPATGTFTSADPTDGHDGTTTVANPYHYTNNDPLNLYDPTGLSPITDDDLGLPSDPCTTSGENSTARAAAGTALDIVTLGHESALTSWTGDSAYCKHNNSPWVRGAALLAAPAGCVLAEVAGGGPEDGLADSACAQMIERAGGDIDPVDPDASPLPSPNAQTGGQPDPDPEPGKVGRLPQQPSADGLCLGESIIERLVYADNPKHGIRTRWVAGREVSRRPHGGQAEWQAMLDASVKVKEKERRGVEPDTGLTVVFRRTLIRDLGCEKIEIFHGYVPGG